MSLLDDKHEVLESLAEEGFLHTFKVKNLNGRSGRLYWFEVHTPEARSAFHRYRNALKRVETLEGLPSGLEISAKPGRYYVFWPELSGAARPRKPKPIQEALKDFGYLNGDAITVEHGGKTLLSDLKPLAQLPVAPSVELPQPRVNPRKTVELPPEALPDASPVVRVALSSSEVPPLEANASVPVVSPFGPKPLPSHNPTSEYKRITLDEPSLQDSPAKAPPKPAQPQKKSAKAKTRPPRKRYFLGWPGWLPGLLFLGVAGYALWRTADQYYNPPEYILPELTGKTPRQSLEAVSRFGLEVQFVEGSDPSKPKDEVLEQSPGPGTRVKPGRRFTLVINKPKLGSVPTLVGRSLEDARQALEASQYGLGPMVRVAAEATQDTVLASIPPEGTPLGPGKPVRLLVSAGPSNDPRETLLPDLSGLKADEARYLLGVAELTPVVVGVASGAPDGQVVGQEPGPGVQLARGSQVRIFVAAQLKATLPTNSPFKPSPLPAPPPPPEPEPIPIQPPVLEPPPPPGPEQLTPLPTDPSQPQQAPAGTPLQVAPPAAQPPQPQPTPPAPQPPAQPPAAQPPAPQPPAAQPSPQPSPPPAQPTPEPPVAQPPAQPPPEPPALQPPPPEPAPPQPAERQVPLSITALPRDSTIQIIVVDEVSQITVFEGPTPLSEQFNDTITVRGNATLRVFVNGQLVEERGL